MAGTKNNEKITKHLQRIFVYAKDFRSNEDAEACENRINAFVKYVRSQVNEETKEFFQTSQSSMYGYISGVQQFPCDFMELLRDWSLDEQFINAYHMHMPATSKKRMEEKIKKEEQAIEERLKKLDAMKATIVED